MPRGQTRSYLHILVKASQRLRARTADSGCKGTNRLLCASTFSIPGQDWQCDEFSFATAVEGGSLAAIICVPQNDNCSIGSRWGKAVLNKPKGTKIRVKIKGFDCSTVTDDEKRSLEAYSQNRRTLRCRAKKNNTNGIYTNESVYGKLLGGRDCIDYPIQYSRRLR